MSRLFFSLVTGVYFGIVLVKSEVVSWFRIQKMFNFQEAHMYIIIGVAIVVGAISLQIIKRRAMRTFQNEEIAIRTKPWQIGMIFGSTLFGMGWAITGACPGPIYAQIGSGEIMALVTFAGAFIGAYLYALWRPRLPH